MSSITLEITKYDCLLTYAALVGSGDIKADGKKTSSNSFENIEAILMKHGAHFTEKPSSKVSKYIDIQICTY